MNFRKELEFPIQVLPCVILILYLFPYLLLGSSSYFTILDNYDSNVISLKVLSESGKIFDNNEETIPNYLNGIPRISLGSEFNFQLWLFILFKPYQALIINAILVTIIAYWGSYLFFKELFKDIFICKIHKKSFDNNFIIICTALCFSILPFYPAGGLSVAGQPMLFFCLWKIYRYESKKIFYLYLFFFPFYSNFVLAGVFILIFLSLFIFISFLKGYKINLNFIYVYVLIIFTYIIVEYRLIHQSFSATFLPHRIEFFFKGENSLIDSFLIISKYSMKAHAEAAPLLIWYTIFLAISLYVIFKNKYKYLIIIIKPVMILITINVFYAVWQNNQIRKFTSSLGILKSFQFDRFYFLSPTFYYIAFGIALLIIINLNLKFKKILGSIVVVILFIQFITILFMNPNYLQFKKFILKQPIHPSFKEYFAENQFTEIKNFIGTSQQSYRVIHIGIDPAVSIYNGFYTIDGYSSYYPLKTKNQFISIVKDELKKNSQNYLYLKNWGNRLYVLPANYSTIGIDAFIYKNVNKQFGQIDIDYQNLKKLNCHYIISALPIPNMELQLLKEFNNKDSCWRVFLYKII